MIGWLQSSRKQGAREAAVKSPIFVVGCGRSGTTLLFDLLAQHPSLARTTGYPDGEDHVGWVRYGGCVMAGIGNVQHGEYGSGINGQQYCLHMTREDVNADIVRDMHRYYREDVLRGDGRKRVLNKQPHLSNKLDYVLGIFPDAKIVHVVRDCEQVVASWLAVMEQHTSLIVYWPRDELLPCFWLMPRPVEPVALARLDRHSQFFPGGGEQLWIDYWCETNLGIGRQMKGREDQLIALRYEDLVSFPEKSLARVTDFCELPPHSYRIENIQSNTAARHAARMTANLKSAIAMRAESVRQLFAYSSGEASGYAAGLYMP